MARIVIFGASEASRMQLSRLLASSGYNVFRICASDAELRRTLDTCEDGIVILAGNFPGELPDSLTADFGSGFQFLLIGRPEVLTACESPHVFKLTYPCSGSVFLGAIEMLSQLHYMHLPHRTGEDKALVEQAKQMLMRRDSIGEAEAHRRIQEYAMHQGMKLIDCAAKLLQGRADHA